MSALLAAALGSVSVGLVTSSCVRWLLARRARPHPLSFAQFAEPPRTLH